MLGGVPASEIHKRIRQTRELTSRPFGQNLIIASSEEGDEGLEYDRARVEAALAEHVPILVLFWGDPALFVERAHAAGAKVLVQTGSLPEAQHAAEVGVDAVIAQGIEAGGHVRATESIWDVLPRVVKAISPVPVIASGGIGDGAGIARAIELGAQGVSLGTRFVASDEAWIHPLYKQRIVEATADDTLYVADLFDVGWPNAPHRVLRNKLVVEWETAGKPPSGKRPRQDEPIGMRRRPWGSVEEWPRYASGMIPPDFEGDPDYGPMWAGTSVSAVNDLKGAAEIVRALVEQAESAFAKLVSQPTAGQRQAIS